MGKKKKASKAWKMPKKPISIELLIDEKKFSDLVMNYFPSGKSRSNAFNVSL